FGSRAEGAGLWLGGQGGIVKANSSQFTVYGATVGVMPTRSYSLGAFYLVSNTKTASVGPVTAETKLAFYGGDFSLHLDPMGVTRIGIKGGLSKVEGKARVLGVSVGASSTDLAIGPSIGFDLKLGSGLSIGAEGAYLRVMADDSYSALLALGALKLWF
ncbi:MAG TPA: hypothetical protein PLH57_05905, partial [Oligoflexia bacterium]|nr:hypothetical protein [Oligoflexia bacterium]